MSISDETLFRELLVDDRTSLHTILDNTRDNIEKTVEVKGIDQNSVLNENIAKCNFCELEFKSAKGKEDHEKVHYIFVCEVCFTVFGRKTDLDNHLKMIHMKSIRKTDAFEFKSAKGKEDHERVPYIFVCEVCFTVFGCQTDLDNHLEKVHMKSMKNTNAFVSETETNVKSQTGRKKFTLTHYNTKEMKTNLKDTKSKSKTLEKRKPDKPAVVCKICHLIFESANVLKNHMVTKHSQIHVKPLLPAVTRYDPVISKAISNMFFKQDSVDAKNFVTRKWCCSVCGKAFLDKGHAMDHGEKHVEGLCYPCPNPGCGKWYQESVGLRGHKRQCRFIPQQSVSNNSLV